eukprot:SAG31_NODE_443_length_15645_cov_51.693169_10_plen_168_part_00
MPKKAATKRKTPPAGASGGGKAMRASNGAKVAVPVDALEFNLVSSGATVHEDYAFLGNQVDISNNNNKFYRGQVLLDGGGTFCWTRWGRVGERGQHKLEAASDVSAAIKLFEAKFKSKTGHKWAGAKESYPGGAAKKYTVIVEKHSNESAAKLEAAGLGAVRLSPSA